MTEQKRGYWLGAVLALACGGVAASDGGASAQEPEPLQAEVELAPLDDALFGAIAETVSAYELAAGETLRGAMERWASEAGWTLVWSAKNDYRVDAPLSFPAGTRIQDAIRAVMRGMWAQSPGLKATLYRNQVIVITENRA